MKISKFQFGNKVPKPSEDFIKQKLGYGVTSTIGTQSQRTQQNQAAQQSQANTDAKNYLAALRKGERWAVTKNLQNRGQITQINQKVNGHIPTQEEINKENQLRQDPIKGIGLRNKEDWENNRSPIKAILKSGVLYANPYTGALNAGYNLANPETGVSATYDAFKNRNYLQGAISGAFNLLDAGMMGNGINKTAQKLIPSYDLYNAVKNGTIQSEKLSPKILYRANVYKGGEIKNPRYSFFTTDEKYASQYGKVKPYIFESKNIAIAKEPLMGAKNPVNQDMMIYENTKNNPSANAIIGYDKVTGEFPYQSHGAEILNLDPNNIFPLKTDNSKRPLKSIGQYSQTPLKYSFDTSVKSFEFPEYKTAISSDLSDGNPIIFDQPYKLNEAVDNLPKRYRTNSNEIINPQDKEFAEIREFENIEPIPATKTIRYKDLEQVDNATRSLGIKNPEIKGIVNWNNDPDISGILLERINADGLKNGFKNILNTQLDNFNTNYPETPILTDYIKDVINNKITTAPNPWLYFSDELSKTSGYFNPNNNQTFINLRQIGPNPEAIGRTVVHENISHFTDNLLPEVIKGKYKSLLNKLNIKDKDSNDWKELRATLNELKFNLSKKGNFNEMKENLYLMDNDELAESLENINSYGSEYVKQLRNNPQLMNSLRKAILTLPATLPFINKGNSE